MEQHHMPLSKKKVFLTILVLMLFLNAFSVNVTKGQPGTQISIKPSNQSVGQPGLSLPTPPFSVNITVDNVNDLSAWQIVLYYNSTFLTYDSEALPSGHVFDGKTYQQAGPTFDTDRNGTYLILAAVLLSGTTFSGSGTLCQIKFIGHKVGTSSLRLSIITAPEKGAYYTYMLDSSGVNEIPISINNGQVTVVGLETPKQPSSITINVDRSSVPLGSNVTVSGNINVTRAGLTVTISYRANGSATWSELTRVSTNATGHYFYPWNTTQNYGIILHELKASWLGDIDYEGAESNPITVRVSKKTSTISLIVHPTNVTAGSNVEISGAVTPSSTSSTRPSVTISFRPVGGNWAVLQPEHQPVQTGIDGNYTFIWTTNAEGSYELKASWQGDVDYEGAESSISAVEVTASVGGQFDIMAYLPYIIAVVAIVAIVGIALYFLKFKKR